MSNSNNINNKCTRTRTRTHIHSHNNNEAFHSFVHHTPKHIHIPSQLGRKCYNTKSAETIVIFANGIWTHKMWTCAISELQHIMLHIMLNISLLKLKRQPKIYTDYNDFERKKRIQNERWWKIKKCSQPHLFQFNHTLIQKENGIEWRWCDTPLKLLAHKRHTHAPHTQRGNGWNEESTRKKKQKSFH